MVGRRKPLYVVDPDDDPYLRRKREQEERARDVPQPTPAADIIPPVPTPTTPKSPVIHESPSVGESPFTDASPFKSDPLALSSESPGRGESPVTRDSPKRSAGTGDSRVKHAFFDEQLCGLDPLAQLLYFHLNRYRKGVSEYTVVVSWARLMERIPVSESTLRRAYTALNRAGLVSIFEHVYGRGGAQGNIFRVVMGESPSTSESPSTGDTHKKKELKANQKAPARCAQCNDTGGFLYPQGFGGGVVKCDHKSG